jgi:hypothetical protein
MIKYAVATEASPDMTAGLLWRMRADHPSLRSIPGRAWRVRQGWPFSRRDYFASSGQSGEMDDNRRYFTTFEQCYKTSPCRLADRVEFVRLGSNSNNLQFQPNSQS